MKLILMLPHILLRNRGLVANRHLRNVFKDKVLYVQETMVPEFENIRKVEMEMEMRTQGEAAQQRHLHGLMCRIRG